MVGWSVSLHSMGRWWRGVSEGEGGLLCVRRVTRREIVCLRTALGWFGSFCEVLEGVEEGKGEFGLWGELQFQFCFAWNPGDGETVLCAAFFCFACCGKGGRKVKSIGGEAMAQRFYGGFRRCESGGGRLRRYGCGERRGGFAAVESPCLMRTFMAPLLVV